MFNFGNREKHMSAENGTPPQNEQAAPATENESVVLDFSQMGLIEANRFQLQQTQNRLLQRVVEQNDEIIRLLKRSTGEHRPSRQHG